MKKGLTITTMLFLLTVWIVATVVLPGIQASAHVYISSEQIDEKEGAGNKEEESAFVKEIQISPRVITHAPQSIINAKNKICSVNVLKNFAVKYNSPLNSLSSLPTPSRLCLFRI